MARTLKTENTGGVKSGRHNFVRIKYIVALIKSTTIRVVAILIDHSPSEKTVKSLDTG